MRKFLQHIHRQPKAVRSQYAMAFAGTFVGIVAFIWVFSLPSRLSFVVDTEEGDGSGAFSTMFDEMGEQLATVKEGIKAATESVATTTTTKAEEITLTKDELESGRDALEQNASSTYINEEPKLVPVLIATTSATRTVETVADTE